MKVMCIIDPSSWNCSLFPIKPPVPEYGEIYIVIETKSCHEIDGRLHDYYILQELPGYAYDSNGFIPLSDIDETEMIREYNKQKELV